MLAARKPEGLQKKTALLLVLSASAPTEGI
jgi:hypothetical protein